ncbi:mycothiol system anti-sigma-R factor [Boudabousia tangfeifanii]|uniref:Mycothiol system anti-sigma-R factor n=1 Tax=Boudabousia tangfeifanii TaxID=1912795 RepID=A0A1D9MJG0_9ACTO|nr:mycothiol system anti-sigma-R factor [Boudabousia tangfeifanii]
MGDCTSQSDLTCEQALESLHEFLDDSLTEEMSQRVERHIASCDYCSTSADVERHFRVLLRKKCVQKAPASLRQRILVQMTSLRIEYQG